MKNGMFVRIVIVSACLALTSAYLSWAEGAEAAFATPYLGLGTVGVLGKF